MLNFVRKISLPCAVIFVMTAFHCIINQTVPRWATWTMITTVLPAMLAIRETFRNTE